jgi:hypothetical protein
MTPHSELMATLAVRERSVNPAGELFWPAFAEFCLVDQLG